MLYTFSTNVICLIFFLKIHLCANNKSLPCHLKWVSSGTGATIPQNLVLIQGEPLLQYAARGTDTSSDTVFVGTYDPESNKATFPFENDNSTATALTTFDLLTNPHECQISLPQLKCKDDKTFAVKIDGSTQMYIGRAYDEGRWYAGTVDCNEEVIKFCVDGETKNSSTFQILTSKSDGLELLISEFQFVNEPFGGALDYIGVDQIRNNGDMTIIQKVEHVNSVTEEVTLKNYKETSSERTHKSGWNILIAGKEHKEEHTYKETIEEEWTTTKETEVRLTYEVEIPPRTVLVLCSTMSIKKNISEAYTAKGVYFAPSLGPEEIMEVLTTSQIPADKISIVGNEVVVPITGLFKGTIAMNSQFVAVSSENGMPSGCFLQQQRIFEEKTRKMMKLREMKNIAM